MTVLKEAQAFEEQEKNEADNEAKEIRMKAETRLAVAKSKSEALIKESTAET